jgi:hypothetical protein
LCGKRVGHFFPCSTTPEIKRDECARSRTAIAADQAGSAAVCHAS